MRFRCRQSFKRQRRHKLTLANATNTSVRQRQWQVMIKLLLFLILLIPSCLCLLYPHESETRQAKSLDGLWAFKLSPNDNQEIGFRDQWYNGKLKGAISMPVPSSYNDITQDYKVRDYLGVAWYQTQFFVPNSWIDRSVYLRFGSVNYEAIVYLNGRNIFNHTGGHLPFGDDVSRFLSFTGDNLLTVAVNNTLSHFSVPQATVKEPNNPHQYPSGYKQVLLNFDFFNYAGIHRSVVLYSVPRTHIHALTYFTKTIVDSNALIEYNFAHSQQGTFSDGEDGKGEETFSCVLQIIDRDTDQIVAKGSKCRGEVIINNATLWWPIGMSDTPGYLYKGKFILMKASQVVDVYYEDIGLRLVQVDDTSLLINRKPVYLTGFGKHEDSAIRGRGFDPVLLVKDFNLLKWIGANSFRTSHYPYAEELMQLADREGIMIIDECPAVGLFDFSDQLLDQHTLTLNELIERDRNHPSVIMWSITNEPHSSEPKSSQYFEKVISVVKQLDRNRPVTGAINANKDTDLLAPQLDVLMINRYFAWYSDMGSLDVIKLQVIDDFEGWHRKYPQKPIIISEYGADTVAGLHASPSMAFSEDYQAQFFLNYFGAFDHLRAKKYFIGEMVWNFADFMTTQTTIRVMGNKKGVFTRDRQPKAGARVLRCRYLNVLNLTATLNEDPLVFCPAARQLGH